MGTPDAYGPADALLLDDGIDRWRQLWDTRGGQRPRPKFPIPTNLDFLLHYERCAVTKLLDHALNAPAWSAGIHDHIGGGFARYSVDEMAHPHFEKMLYDNAQLAGTFARAWQAGCRRGERPDGLAAGALHVDFVQREWSHARADLFRVDADRG